MYLGSVVAYLESLSRLVRWSSVTKQMGRFVKRVGWPSLCVAYEKLASRSLKDEYPTRKLKASEDSSSAGKP